MAGFQWRAAVVLAQVLMAGAAWGQTAMTRDIGAGDAGTVLGRNVSDSAGADAGLLVDVLVGPDGAPLAGIIDVGGFLGVGVRRVAVAWPLLHFEPDAGGTRIHMDLTVEAAAAAPEFHGPDGTTTLIVRPPP